MTSMPTAIHFTDPLPAYGNQQPGRDHDLCLRHPQSPDRLGPQTIHDEPVLYDFGYDHMDRITSITSSIDCASAFTYDRESELTGSEPRLSHRGRVVRLRRTGNRTGGSYTTTTNNRTTSDGTYDYQYDDEGNRTRKTEISSSDYQTYEWDYRNRLIGVEFYDSGDTLLSTVEYSYDAFNRLVRRIHDADDPAVMAATEEFFAYDGQSINAVLEFDADAASDLAHRNLWA